MNEILINTPPFANKDDAVKASKIWNEVIFKRDASSLKFQINKAGEFITKLEGNQSFDYLMKAYETHFGGLVFYLKAGISALLKDSSVQFNRCIAILLQCPKGNTWFFSKTHFNQYGPKQVPVPTVDWIRVYLDPFNEIGKAST